MRLRSADPGDLPLVDPNFLGHAEDLGPSVEGVKISREIFSQPSLQKFIKRIRFPDDDVKTQADFEAYARQYGRTSYHPTGTCKMGSDPRAVVDDLWAGVAVPSIQKLVLLPILHRHQQ